MSNLRNISYTFASKMANLVIGLVTSIVMVRVLGAEGKGLFSLAILAAALVTSLSNLGLGTGSGYLLGRLRFPRDVLAGNWLSMSMLIGIPVMVVSIFFVPVLAPRLLPTVSPDLVIIALVGVPFSILLYNLQMLCKADSDFRGYNLLELAQPALFILAMPLAIRIFTGSNVLVTISVYTASCVSAAVIAVAIWAGRTKLRFRLSREVASPALRFGIMGHLTNVLGFLNLRLDMLLVNWFLGPAAVGYYSISVMIAEKIWYFPDTLAIVLYPKVAHSNDLDASAYTSKTGRLTVLIVGACSVLVLLLGKPVIRLLYTDQFIPAVAPLFILLPGVLSASLARVVGSDLLARGYPHVNMWAGLAALAVNMGLNIVMIPLMGISGAALATTVSYTLHLFIILVSFCRITGLRVWDVLVPVTGDLDRFPRAVRGFFRLRQDERKGR